MNVLDLFSGIGGFSLGLERAGMETIAFCEQDKFCQKVLRKHWPDILILEDIKKLDGKPFRGKADVICGGFPCQPFSVAGKRKGSEDDRYLWPEMFRVIQEAKPGWIIAENVTGIIGMGLDQVLSDLESEGYETETLIIPACAVNAHHRRDRIWIIGNSKSCDDEGLQKRIRPQKQFRNYDREFRRNFWRFESSLCRVVDGIPGRVDRLKALGNAVVPQIVEIIGKAVMSFYE